MKTFPGVSALSPSAGSFYETRLHSKFIASAATNWVGLNRTGYANPRADALLDKLAGAIDPRDQAATHRDLLAEMMGDVAAMPLYWEVVPVLALKGVKTQKVVRTHATGTFFEWDRE